MASLARILPFTLATLSCAPASEIEGGEIFDVPFEIESAMVYPVHRDSDFAAPESFLSVNLSPDPDLCANLAAGFATEQMQIFQLNVEDTAPLAPGVYEGRNVAGIFMDRESCDLKTQTVGISVAGRVELSSFAPGGDAAGEFIFTLVTFDFSNESKTDVVEGSFNAELCDFDPDEVGFQDPCEDNP